MPIRYSLLISKLQLEYVHIAVLFILHNRVILIASHCLVMSMCTEMPSVVEPFATDVATEAFDPFVYDVFVSFQHVRSSEPTLTIAARSALASWPDLQLQKIIGQFTITT